MLCWAGVEVGLGAGIRAGLGAGYGEKEATAEVALVGQCRDARVFHLKRLLCIAIVVINYPPPSSPANPPGMTDVLGEIPSSLRHLRN